MHVRVLIVWHSKYNIRPSIAYKSSASAMLWCSNIGQHNSKNIMKAVSWSISSSFGKNALFRQNVAKQKHESVQALSLQQIMVSGG